MAKKYDVIVVGDAAVPVEAWVQGAVAMAYQAVKAIEKELDGKEGYPQYMAWWKKAFAFNFPEYAKAVALLYSLHGVCSDEDIDYIYKLFQGRIGMPTMLVYRNLDLIKQGRPELYQKLTKGKT